MSRILQILALAACIFPLLALEARCADPKDVRSRETGRDAMSLLKALEDKDSMVRKAARSPSGESGTRKP